MHAVTKHPAAPPKVKALRNSMMLITSAWVLFVNLMVTWDCGRVRFALFVLTSW